MSLLNFSTNKSAMKSDIFNYQAGKTFQYYSNKNWLPIAENSSNFKEYSTFGEFERFFTINIGKLSAEID